MKWKKFFDWINNDLKLSKELDNICVQAVLLKLNEYSDKKFPEKKFKKTMLNFTFKLVEHISQTVNKIPIIETKN